LLTSSSLFFKPHSRLASVKFQLAVAGIATSIISFPVGECQAKHGLDHGGNLSYASYDANSPSEDRFSVFEDGDWKACGVFDGHGGWQVSDYVQQNLVAKVLKKIKEIVPNDSTALESAVISSFLEVEKSYIELIRPAYQLGFGDVASVGSCALLALRNHDNLIIANCGDSRAVLGSVFHSSVGRGATESLPNSPGGSVRKHLLHPLVDQQESYVAQPLTHDHNARLPLEEFLLKRDHPDEVDIVKCKTPEECYVKGRLQVLGNLQLRPFT